MHRLLIISLISIVTPALTHPGVAGNRVTPELLWKLGRLESACVDPAGNRVAYVVRHYDLQKNTGTSAIHLLDLKTHKDQVLVGSLKGADSIQFAATNQGIRLFYVATMKTASQEGADDGAKPQVWSIPAAGGVPTQVTQLKEGVANLKVSPTNTHLAFTVRVKMDATANELFKDLPQANARIIDHLMYRHWNVWHDYAYSHVHVAMLKTDGRAAEPIDLMRGIRANCPLEPFGGAEDFSWSPDGREIALTAKIVNDPAESTDSDIYLAAIDGKQALRCITPEMNGYDTQPSYSPNGRYLAFHSMRHAGFESDRNRLMIYDRASGSIRELTKGLDQTVNDAVWMRDSNSLVFMSEHLGTEQLFQIELARHGARQITRGWHNWGIAGALPDGQRLLVTSQNMIRPKELSLVNIQDGKAVRVTHINDTLYKNLEVPTIKQRWIRSSDGAMVHCWVIYPPNFDPSKKWPMLTYCQGGPQAQIGQSFSYRWNFHLMASHGYVVLAPNRRGLPGFGQKWNDQISGDWGGQAMQDILAATDAMMVEPYIDTQRIGAIGASFGGYTVYWLMGHNHDRFCCMIAHAGVFDLESMYGSTEELFFPNWDLGGPYWKSRQLQHRYDQFSPNRFVRNWKTPLLIIHGEKDFRVPVTQGMEAFTAAKVQGVPARFLYFPTECHWVLEPQNGVLWHRVFFQWLDRWCGVQ